MKPLFVPLATEPFERFAQGIKTVEVRQAKPRWVSSVKPGRAVLLRRGYSTQDNLWGTVGRVAVADRVRDLPLWAKEGAHLADVQQTIRYRHGREMVLCYFDPDKAVLAFEVLDLDRRPR
jgi:hypothetical protein